MRAGRPHSTVGGRVIRFANPWWLVLLLAASAQGQPTVGDEVIWRTTLSAATYRPAPQAARVAADGGGFVVAWSEFDSDGISRACA